MRINASSDSNDACFLWREDMSRADDSSPLATVDDIHRRLLRPSSLHSPAIGGSKISSELKANPTSFVRKQGEKPTETTKKKLEDYLDPVLLAAITSKIGSRAKIQESTKSKRKDKDFEWPVDKLTVFMEDSRTAKRNSEDVNRDDDLELIDDGGDGDGQISTPFWRSEQTALKRFKGAG